MIIVNADETEGDVAVHSGKVVAFIVIGVRLGGHHRTAAAGDSLALARDIYIETETLIRRSLRIGGGNVRSIQLCTARREQCKQGGGTGKCCQDVIGIHGNWFLIYF